MRIALYGNGDRKLVRDEIHLDVGLLHKVYRYKTTGIIVCLV